MKFTRPFILFVSASLLLSACSNESDEAAVSVSENSNPLLAYVPVDTAYVFADTETVPEEITDAYVERFQPVLDLMSEHTEKFKAEYQAGEHQDDQLANLAIAVLDELGGSLSAQSLGKLGISMQAHHAIYATGVFPVIRLGLSDAQELRNAISRIEVKMGYELPEKDLNGTAYWQLSEDGQPVAVYIAILDQQLAISLFPVSAEDTLLAAFLGQEMPSQSMASSNALAIMNNRQGYTGYGSGIVDIQKLADEFLDSDSSTRQFLGQELNMKLSSLDPVCVSEYKSIIAMAPRMTAGTTRLTANELGMRYNLEIENALAKSLTTLVSNTPPANEGDFLLSASLAVKVGNLRSFLLEKATAVFESPYQCVNLQDINQQAKELMAQLNIPMPPMINNRMGLRVQVDDFDPANDISSAEGLLALHVDKPEMFVGMASMMVPGFDELDLANQTEPVKIPSEMTRMEGLNIFSLMTKEAIGVSVGEQHVKDLAGFMSAKPRDSGIFLSVSHDMAKQMEIQDALTQQYPGLGDDNPSEVHEFSEAMEKAYSDMLGRSWVEMRFTADGLQMSNDMTFK
jgi:hypothetical protein